MDHEELIAADAEKAVAAATSRGKSKRLAAEDIGAVFGIEIDAGSADASHVDAPSGTGQEKTAARKPRAKKKPSKTEEEKVKAGGKAKKTVKKQAVARRKAEDAL